MSKGWGLVGDVGRLEVTSLGCNATRPEWTLSDALARWRMQWIPINVTVTVRVEETDSGLGHEYTSRFWVENPAWKHRKNVVFFS